MRYRIVHRTAYHYASPVYESFNEVRLRPCSGETQTCLNFDLAIDPPATVVTFNDYYGNAVHDFGVPYLHDHLTIEATSDVVTFAAADEPLAGPRNGDPDRSPALAALAADPLVSDEWAEFLDASAYVALEGASGELARAILAEGAGTTAYDFLVRAGVYIRSHFTYQVGATNVRTTVAEVIAGGSGVCQDYAHLLIALCRHVGLPARYVSGYLGNVAQSSASHAWTEAFLPPYGWIGLDPTLGTPCTGRHVKVAVGRDYADVPPLRGTYRGGGEAELDVEVRGEMLEEAQGISLARTPNDDWGRGKLIQYQTLGASAQMQRLGAMRQSLGGMTQTMKQPSIGEVPGVRHQHTEAEVPRQQPQQQQQGGANAQCGVWNAE
jgi:transglutaminase-like putative cysteine protease